MTAIAIIREFRDRGARLEVNGDSISVKAPVGAISPELRESLKLHKAEVLAALKDVEAANDEVIDPAVEARRQRLLAMLDERKDKTYAVIVDADSDPEEVIVARAKRGGASAELRIPKSKYDPFLLMALVDKYYGTEH